MYGYEFCLTMDDDVSKITESKCHSNFKIHSVCFLQNENVTWYMKIHTSLRARKMLVCVISQRFPTTEKEKKNKRKRTFDILQFKHEKFKLKIDIPFTQTQ